MSKQKLTDWFPADVKPTRVGVYNTRTPHTGSLGYQYWNGFTWRFWGYDPDDAYMCKEDLSGSQKVEWRGLAENPNAKDKI